ncbi:MULTISPECIES: pyrroline-5-carboxylate reductase [unclassified Lactobacillus]|uniref:pyrroline-5-carboxylate reductase family protein n=1 Tax=unclassified Lactobacillus TaxID=2620435 RepID=UPI001314B918|nr:MULTISPECIES: pyrroline-5-carboxylate reductase [unclassified Lactobacillus]
MKIGFIGTGKIGTAIVQGLLQAKTASEDIYIYDGGHASAQKLATRYGLQLVDTYNEFEPCEAVIVAVGGSAIDNIFIKLGQVYHGIIISTGGGDLKKVKQLISADATFVKVVPNTPVKIGRGITVISFLSEEKQEVIELTKNIFACMGDVYVVPENKLGIYGTIAGCTPAYVDLLIQALSDAAVENGVKRTDSYEIIEKMLIGTAQLALDTKKLPEELKNEVTTPGGSTIKGVNKLEELGFRGALIQATNASAN